MTTKTDKIPIVPVQTGEVFLQDKIIDEQRCFICKKEFDKFSNKGILFLRKSKGEMIFACDSHNGIVQEYVKQFRRLPDGWEKERT